MPAVQPVAYRLDDEEITRHPIVGFEVDDFDLQTRTGWSVLGIGQAYEVVDPARLAEPAHAYRDPWVRDHDAHMICIPLQLVTGSRIVAD
jgi:uncharacterized protein